MHVTIASALAVSRCIASGFVHSDDMQMIWCDSDEGEFERISREIGASEWVGGDEWGMKMMISPASPTYPPTHRPCHHNPTPTLPPLQWPVLGFVKASIDGKMRFVDDTDAAGCRYRYIPLGSVSPYNPVATDHGVQYCPLTITMSVS